MKPLQLMLSVLLLFGLTVLPSISYAQFGKFGKITKVVTQPQQKNTNSNTDNSSKNNSNTNNSSKNSSNVVIPENEKYDCPNKVVTNGFSSDIHKKYTNKIVFSKHEIVKSDENESAFTNSFSLADNIYGRVYIENSALFTAQSMGLCCQGRPYCSTTNVRYIIDNQKVNEVNIIPEYPKDAWTTWQIGVSPSREDFMNSSYLIGHIFTFKDIAMKLSEGTHTIRVELYLEIPNDTVDDKNELLYKTKFGSEKILASGEFKLQVKKMDKTVLEDKYYIKPITTSSSNSSSSSGSQSCYVEVKNNSGESIKFDLYTSGSRSTESLSSNSSKSINCGLYEKIVITDGRCKDVTYNLKGMAGQSLVLCGK
ncbi:MAG: hypothetical protein KDC72_08060 [Bacteroidetes bacterium]|nr:hypothetical protein [Bacteroidota bacterium]